MPYGKPRNNTTEALLEELKKLRQENLTLKQQVTRLSEKSPNKDSAWMYALEGNRDGIWEWNAVTDEVIYSPRWKEMLGYENHEISNLLSEWERRIHPDDRAAVDKDLEKHMTGETPYYRSEHRVRCKDGSYKWMLDRGKTITWTEDGRPLKVYGTHTDVTLRKEAELENLRLLKELEAALKEVNVLNGLIPICSKCKRIRDDKGYWNHLESYIEKHSNAAFSHGICPECNEDLYGDKEWYIEMKKKKE